MVEMSDALDDGWHHIEFKSAQQGNAVGWQTIILFDGKPLRGITNLSLDCSAEGFNVVTVTLRASVDFDLRTKAKAFFELVDEATPR